MTGRKGTPVKKSALESLVLDQTAWMISNFSSNIGMAMDPPRVTRFEPVESTASLLSREALSLGKRRGALDLVVAAGC